MICIVDRSLFCISVLSYSYAADLYSSVGNKNFVWRSFLLSNVIRVLAIQEEMHV